MSGAVDRTGTNWTPWPRLAGVPQRLQVIGGVAAIMGAALVMQQWRSRTGGKLPSTVTKEWADASKASMDAKECESGGTVVLNPITKSIREKK